MASVGRYEMTFKLLGHDQASKVIEKVDGKFKKTAAQADKTGAKFSKAGKDMGGLTGAIGKFIPGGDGVIKALGGMGAGAGGAGLGFMGLAGGVMAAVAALFAFRGQAEEAAALTFRLSRLGDGFGETTIAIRKLKREAGGVYSTKQLVDFMTVQKEMNVDLGITAENLQKLDLRFTALGLDVGSGLRQMTEAIKTGRQMYLQKLGLVDNLTEAWKKESDAIGHVLSQEEKMAVTIREVRKGMEGIEVGGSGGPITAFERITATFSDFGVSMGELFNPIFEALAPFVEAIQALVESLVPAASIIMRPFQAGFQVIGELLRGVLDVVASFLVPIMKTLDRILSDQITEAVEGIRSGFVALAGIAEEIAGKVMKWVGGIGGLISSVVNFIASDPLGLLTEQEKKRAAEAMKSQEIAEQLARDLEWQAEVLEKQKSTMADLDKFWSKTGKAVSKSTQSLVKAESNLLKMKDAAGTITESERDRLAELAKILRVETATGAIKAQMASNVKTLIDLEKQRAKILEDPLGVDITEIQKLGAALAKMNEEQIRLQELAFLAGEAALDGPVMKRKAPKTRAKAKKDFDLNAELSSIRNVARENEKSIKIRRINIELRQTELDSIGAKTESERIALSLKQELLNADIKEIEGKRLMADHLREVAHARSLASQAAREEAEATRDVSAALSSLGAMSGQFAGNELATMGTAMAGLASISSKLEQNQIGVSEAIAGSGGVVAAAAGEFIDSKRSIAAIMAVFETAAAFAAFPNVAAMAAHGSAAALYGGIAAGVGSVGGAGGAASPGLQAVSKDIDRERDRGDRQIVINISGVVTDAQGIGAQIKTALGSMEGTGV